MKTAEERDIDRRIVRAPHPELAGAGPLAQIDADQERSLQDHAADPEAARRALAEVNRIVGDTRSTPETETTPGKDDFATARRESDVT